MVFVTDGTIKVNVDLEIIYFFLKDDTVIIPSNCQILSLLGLNT